MTFIYQEYLKFGQYPYIPSGATSITADGILYSNSFSNSDYDSSSAVAYVEWETFNKCGNIGGVSVPCIYDQPLTNALGNPSLKAGNYAISIPARQALPITVVNDSPTHFRLKVGWHAEFISPLSASSTTTVSPGPIIGNIPSYCGNAGISWGLMAATTPTTSTTTTSTTTSSPANTPFPALPVVPFAPTTTQPNARRLPSYPLTFGITTTTSSTTSTTTTSTTSSTTLTPIFIQSFKCDSPSCNVLGY